MADLARTRVACRPDPMWEIVLSLHVLQSRRRTPSHQSWLVDARRRATEHGMAASIRHLLLPLAPVASYFPDFLTPTEGADGIEAGVHAVEATPRSTMHEQFALMASRTSVPAWCRALAEGERELRRALGDALRAYHDTMLAPWMDEISQSLAKGRDLKVRAMARGGISALFDGLNSYARWENSTLIAPYPPRTRRTPGWPRSAPGPVVFLHTDAGCPGRSHDATSPGLSRHGVDLSLGCWFQ